MSGDGATPAAGAMAARPENSPQSIDIKCGELNMNKALMAKVMEKVGGTMDSPIDIFGAIPRDLLVPMLPSVASPSGEGTVTMMEIGAIMKFYQAIGNDSSSGTASTGPITPTTIVAPSQAPPGRHKVSDAVDQMDETPFDEPSDEEMRSFRQNYSSVTGGRPPLKYMPTSKQIGGLQAKMKANKPPYADFALFNCHGQRMAKITKFAAQVWINNRLETKHLHGPASFDAWMDCWQLYKVTMVSLLSASPQRLDDYASGIQELQTLFPHAWGIIFAADELMRAEQWQLIRDDMLDKNEWPENRPWDEVLAKTTFGRGDVERQHWWNTHVVFPASTAGGGMKTVQAIEGSPYIPVPDGLYTNSAASHGGGKGSGTATTSAGPGAGKKTRRMNRGSQRSEPYQNTDYDHNKGKSKSKNKGKTTGTSRTPARARTTKARPRAVRALRASPRPEEERGSKESGVLLSA